MGLIRETVSKNAGKRGLLAGGYADRVNIMKELSVISPKISSVCLFVFPFLKKRQLFGGKARREEWTGKIFSAKEGVVHQSVAAFIKGLCRKIVEREFNFCTSLPCHARKGVLYFYQSARHEGAHHRGCDFFVPFFIGR